MMNVIWKVSNLSLRVASVRLRTLLPALALARLGYHVTVSDAVPCEEELRQADAIIINKGFHSEDLALARTAGRLGIPVIFDLCDNVFSRDYGDGSGREASQVQSILKHCSALTSTGKPLAATIIQNCDFEGSVTTIPDSEERLSEVSFLIDFWNDPSTRNIVPGLKIKPVRGFEAEHFIFSESRARRFYNIAFKGDGSLRNNRKTVLWFGTPGRSGGRTGLYSLRMVKDALETVNRDIPLQLLVVTSSRKLFREFTGDFAVPRIYRPWSLLSMYDVFKLADVTVLPNPQDEFSFGKSANRAIFSLAENTPVVASSVPSLEDFKDYIVQDQWEAGLRTYLENADRAWADVSGAQRVISQKYSLETIRDKWSTLLQAVAA